MVTRHGKSGQGFTVAAVSEDAQRVWLFGFIGGASPRFAATFRHGKRSVTWPDVQRTIAEWQDLNRLPEGIAAWIRQLTGGAIPSSIADEAAVRVGRWLAVHEHGVERGREHSAKRQ